jgi:hypothetical protein
MSASPARDGCLGIARQMLRGSRYWGLPVCLLTLAVAQAAELRGRSVADVLTELRAQGWVFIYNTQVLNDDIRVKQPPQATGGLELAREILAEHDLALMPVADKIFAVVRVKARGQQNEIPPVAATLDEVVVQTSRYSLANDASAHTLLTQEQVQNLPKLGDETLRAVQRLPGAAVNGWAALGPIRGGAPNETGIYLDGMRLYEPFHLKNFLSPMSLLDARLIHSMDVYSGGYSAQYGDHLSSIIDAKTVQPAQARYYELGLTALHVNGLLALQAGDTRFFASGRRSNLPELSQLSEQDFGNAGYNDGFARVQYDFSGATRGSLNVLSSRDDIVARKDEGAQQARADYRNTYLWGSLTHDWSERAESRLLLGYTDVTNRRSGSVSQPNRRNGAVNDARTFEVANLRLDHRWNTTLFERAIEHRFGAEWRELSAQYRYGSDVRFETDFPLPDSPAVQTQRAVALSSEGGEIGGYWDARIEANKQWALQGGLRIDRQGYHGEVDATQVSPRASVLYAPTPRTRLRATWGRYFQSQAINELQVEDGVNDFYPAQQAMHSIVAIEQTLAAGYELRIEAYRKDYTHVQPRYENVFDPLSLLPEAEFDRVSIAPTSARAEGVEALLTVRPESAWSGWLSYTWSRVEDRFITTQGRWDVPRSWDQTHAVNLGIAWTRGPWAITLAHLYHSGWPTTPVDLQSPNGVGARNAARLPPYHSMDVRISRSFVLSRGELDVFVEAANLTSRQNICCTQYSFGRDANGATNVGVDTDYWLRLTPSAGILWRY